MVIADISGSMERYTELFLYFIHAAQGRLGRVESFVFATRLSRITREMRLREPRRALARVGRAASRTGREAPGSARRSPSSTETGVGG